MSSRAIKGPVGKRLTTICSEHVSGHPPGNKSPLRLWPLFPPLLSSHSILHLFSYGRRRGNDAACEPRREREREGGRRVCMLVSPSFFVFRTFSLRPSFSFDSRQRLAFPARHATSKSSCFLSATSSPASSFRSADPRIILHRRLTVPRDPVRSWLLQASSHCVRGRSPFIRSWYFKFA